MIIHLVRHTTVEWDGSVICYGNTDVRVRDTFPEEAEVVRQRIAYLSPEATYSSPLSRASMLADYCGYSDAERDDRLREMNFGNWEGRLWSDIIPDDDVLGFFERYIHEPTPGGESQMMQYNRIKAFLEEKKAQGLASMLVFCHGGVINCVRTLVGEVALNEAFASIPDFGSLTTLEL